MREQRARREAEETRKALSGRVSYLLNKSALDDESRANARIDVKKLEKQMHTVAKMRNSTIAAKGSPRSQQSFNRSNAIET